jgi:dipeptidyl aminopeptidase
MAMVRKKFIRLLTDWRVPHRHPSTNGALFFLLNFFCQAELNAVELRPPHMDDSGRTKYPVLFRVYANFCPMPPEAADLVDPPPPLPFVCPRQRYGGPSSQLVSASFNIDWHAYLACGLQYVIVVVDGRGTGYKGRALRNPVKGNLGFWEVRDQVNAAR